MHRWHVLFTKPRCERRVGEVLAGRGIDVFVPLVFYHGKHGNMLDKPLFPRYMFAHLDWQATGVKEVRWTPGLTRVVMFQGEPAVMPDEKLEYLRNRLECFDGDQFMRIKPGERVRVTRGPFADVEAIFECHMNSQRRVAVLMEILGRETRVIVAADDVERKA